MPEFSTRKTASRMTASLSTRFDVSSLLTYRRASAIVTIRRTVRFGIIELISSCMFRPISSPASDVKVAAICEL